MKILIKCAIAFALAALSLPVAATPNVYSHFSPSAGLLKGTANSYFTQSAVAADVYGLWSGTCSVSTFLRGDGACAAPAGSGITFSMPSGFTVTGSPGSTISVSTTLNGVLKGNGSGFTTSLAADIYGLWSGTCSSSTFLRGDGACAAAGGGSPSSPSNSVQFNNSGSFGGSSNFVWDNTNGVLSLGGPSGGLLDTLTGENLSLIGGNALSDLTSASCSINVGGGASGAGGSIACNAGNAVTSGAGGSNQLNGGNAAGTNQGGGPVSMSAGSSTGSASNGTASIATHGINRLVVLENGVWNVSGGSGTAGQVLQTNGSTTPPAWAPISLTGTTGSIGGGALIAGACATGTATVTGVTTAMAIIATPVTTPGAAFYESPPYVSATNTVTVSICAAVAGTPAASVYNIRVLQ